MDAIGDAREQAYFQVHATGHNPGPVHPYDQYEAYYEKMYPGGHLDHVQTVYGYHPYQNLDSREASPSEYLALFGGGDLMAQLGYGDDGDDDDSGDSDDDQEYLVLAQAHNAGARELFAQLGNMEPRPKRERRKRGAGRKRNEAPVKESDNGEDEAPA